MTHEMDPGSSDGGWSEAHEWSDLFGNPFANANIETLVTEIRSWYEALDLLSRIL